MIIRDMQDNRLVRIASRRLLALACFSMFVLGGMIARANDEATAQQVSAEAAEFFERSIRPVLVESCQQCHGPLKQKAGLRLDSREALIKGGETGAAIIPGDPEKSLLIRAISYTDQDLQMPPAAKLSNAQIADLTEWIRQGAPWPEASSDAAASSDLRAGFWAFQPITRTDAPTVKNNVWVKTPVDAFILAKLESKNLSPAPPTDKGTLLRRVTYDLIGLPPTPEEVDAFLSDESPEAFENVVERLLASPHFGERWARHWLDVVAYAETDGHEYDVEKPNAWRYRDYVVRALNDDLPYDRFMTEHFAGDQIDCRLGSDGQQNEAILGTGFYYLGEVLNSPVDSDQALADRTDRQIDVISKAFLGLTVSCARCHYHKSDPISQEDYYALAGILRSSRVRQASIDSPERAAFQRLRAAQILANDAELGEWRCRAEAEAAAASVTEAETTAHYPGASEDPGVKIYEDFDGALKHDWKTAGAAFENGVGPKPVSEFQMMRGNKLARDGGRGYLSSGRVSDRQHGMMISPIFVSSKPFIHFRVAGSGTIKIASDESYDIPTVRVTSGERFEWKTVAVKAFIGKFNYIELSDLNDGASLVLDSIVFSDAPKSPDFLTPNPLPENINPAKFKTAEEFSDHPEHQELSELMARRERLEAGLQANSFGLSAMDDTITDAHLFIRGNHKTPGEAIPRRFLEVIAGTEQPRIEKGSGRLELARRMTDPTNPLPARVMANRIWLHLFGRGIVRTPDNFGAGGFRPTHPELLDFLASEFVESGWSVKHLIRMILLSNAYQMSSRPVAEAEVADASNDLFHRQNLRRLEAEAIRDAILAVSGRLDLSVGGPGVPPYLTPYMDGRGKPAESGPLDGSGRRSIYLAVRRNFINPMFLAFDYPTPVSPMGMRGSSTVPAQALVLMNNPFVVEQAGLWGGRIFENAEATDKTKIEAMYLSAFGRTPTPEELSAALEFIESQKPAAVAGESDAALRKPWTDLAHALFNVAEFIYVN